MNGTSAAEPAPHGEIVETTSIRLGELSVRLRDNTGSPKTSLSGVDSLFHVAAAGDFDAFDPDAAGASAGLNFEHVISGHPNQANSFTSRHGRYELQHLPGSASAVLVRKAEDDPWSLSSTFKYTVRPPHYLDFEFQCQAHRPELFGRRGYAVLFFADYMNDVADIALHFRGIEAPGAPERWIRAEAPPGHADHRSGGTYRSAPAADLAYDADHNFKLNLWSYDWPRFTAPFYYGRAVRDMAFVLMFDRLHTPEDEIRFSLFKFKVPTRPRPAWDFQYVIHRVEAGRTYGFKGRLVWKRFVSPEDCAEEYRRWSGK